MSEMTDEEADYWDESFYQKSAKSRPQQKRRLFYQSTKIS